MEHVERVNLLELEPDLGHFLTEEDAEHLEGLAVPVIAAPAGPLDLHPLLSSQRAFGVLVLDGMLLRRITVGESATLRLLGPGDIVGSSSGAPSMLVCDTGWRAAAPTRLAVLGREVLLAAHRAPRLVAGLQARSAEQCDRVALQLAICQLPRVEDRLLSMLWLLAESWGQVTGQGTALRLALTHETLGGLVGARRSTITLALGQLTDDGAIRRHDGGWMLLQAPPGLAVRAPHAEIAPDLLAPLAATPPRHTSPADIAAEVTAQVNALRETRAYLTGLREQDHRRTQRDLARVRETRLRSAELRREARERRAARSSLLARLHHQDDPAEAVASAERQADGAAREGLPAPVDGVER